VLHNYFNLLYYNKGNHKVNPKKKQCFIKGLPLKKVKNMSGKNKKLFGVWMDSHNATILGKEDAESKEFMILGHVKNAGPDKNSNENAANNQEITLTHKFFKEIASLMPNIDEIHITGTGQSQEQFMKFLAETPQYKNAISTESTSNKMSDENLALFMMKHFN
jgi:stalled ribosome rescue protein Dom34